jgi:hypothetical protein
MDNPSIETRRTIGQVLALAVAIAAAVYSFILPGESAPWDTDPTTTVTVTPDPALSDPVVPALSGP